jgi:8-oxo-dGTP pyrophosphatase MutT (NUDIX family)
VPSAPAARRPPIKDPEAVPVVGTDVHLAAIAPQVLESVALKARFARHSGWQAVIAGDGGADMASLRNAAVLVPLVMRAHGLCVLLTRRADHLHDHPGQISFPGGRVDDGDADIVATALRETEEEVGVARRYIEVIGQLPDYVTVTQYRVTPVIALVDPNYTLALDAFEVAEAFEVPLAFLMNPAHHQRHEFEFAGARRQFLSMPWHGVGSAGEERRFFIWGATAAMLRNLYHALQD